MQSFARFCVLCGIISDEAVVLREVRMLGMDFPPPRAVILIDAVDYIMGGDQTNISHLQIQRRAQEV